MADLELRSAAITVPIRRGHNAFGYVFEGEVMGVGPGHLVVLGDGDEVEISGEGRLLLLAGKPLREPVARHGPFVMSTREELVQAFEDYRRGSFIGKVENGVVVVVVVALTVVAVGMGRAVW